MVVSTHGGQYAWWSVRMVVSTHGGQYAWWSVRMVRSSPGRRPARDQLRGYSSVTCRPLLTSPGCTSPGCSSSGCTSPGCSTAGLRLEGMTISRRAFVLGGAGAMVLVGAGGVGLVEAGALPGRTKLDNLLGWDGGGGTVPSIEPGPMVSGSFRSAARRTTVGYTIVRPPGRTGRMPVAVTLHGRDANHSQSITGLHYDRYLAAAMAAGAPPFALVLVDGGNTVYWHKRANGDDPLTMITHELLPLVADQGLNTSRIGLTGWSMGGYGSLLMGQQLGPEKVRAVAAVSPAIFADYASSSAGSFDSEADFRTNDPRNFPDKLKDIAVLIDCGTDDPFAGQAEQMRNLVRPTPAGGMSRGAHTDRYMTRVAPEQMAFLGEQLHSG